CVVNLARTVQPAELDLQAFAGLAPVEMSGLTAFPRVTTQPYFLTLGPYGVYWFTLEQEVSAITPRATALSDPNAAILEALPDLLVGVDWETIFDGGTRTVLEQRALAPYLQRQRWFASRSRTVHRARFTDWTTLRRGGMPAFLAVASIEYED